MTRHLLRLGAGLVIFGAASLIAFVFWTAVLNVPFGVVGVVLGVLGAGYLIGGAVVDTSR